MSFPQPEITSLNAPYWDALKQGRLTFQHCRACGHNWLPAREACPTCLSPDPQWKDSAGKGSIVSWVVYHVAYDEAFKDRIPYNVSCIALDEGPRILTNIVGCDAGSKLAIAAPVSLCIEFEGDLALARFKLAEPSQP